MIVIIENKQEWNALLAKVDSYDFYHTYDYHYSIKKENETPILIKYLKGNVLILIPFLKRVIDSTYCDLTSAHGYIGPVHCNIDDAFNNSEFITEFTNLLSSEKIVSVFSKLNPYIKNQQKVISTNDSIIETYGEIIYFDQELDDISQLNQYNKNTKQKIRQLEKICYTETVKSTEDYKNFISLYHESMKRLNACSSFFFNDAYFKPLLNSSMFDAKMIIAKHNETHDIMAGVFCVSTKEIAHIELAFMNTAYFKHSPIRILFEECRKLYKNNSIKYLNVGGGSGGRNGSLMKFKATFTKNFTEYSVWKFIILPEVYDALLTQNQKNQEASYFPKYRLESTN